MACFHRLAERVLQNSLGQRQTAAVMNHRLHLAVGASRRCEPDTLTELTV